MNLKPGVEINIVKAEPAEGYRLWLTFSDQYKTLVDFAPVLERSMNPQTRQFLDEKLFRSFRLEWGNLVWGDYEMCFPIADLYEGLEAERCISAVAEESVQYGEGLDQRI